MRLLICGDRNWADVEAIRQLINALPADTVVIHGAARGADRIAGELALDRFCKLHGPEAAHKQVIAFPAQWSRYGRAAGPVRNQQMLDEGRPDKVVFFHRRLDESRGTRDMVERALKVGLPVADGCSIQYTGGGE